MCGRSVTYFPGLVVEEGADCWECLEIKRQRKLREDSRRELAGEDDRTLPTLRFRTSVEKRQKILGKTLEKICARIETKFFEGIKS